MLPGPARTAASVLRRAIIRAAYEHVAREWPGNTYPDVAEMAAAMAGTTAAEVRHVVLGEPMEESVE